MKAEHLDWLEYSRTNTVCTCVCVCICTLGQCTWHVQTTLNKLKDMAAAQKTLQFKLRLDKYIEINSEGSGGEIHSH